MKTIIKATIKANGVQKHNKRPKKDSVSFTLQNPSFYMKDTGWMENVKARVDAFLLQERYRLASLKTTS